MDHRDINRRVEDSINIEEKDEEEADTKWVNQINI